MRHAIWVPRTLATLCRPAPHPVRSPPNVGGAGQGGPHSVQRAHMDSLRAHPAGIDPALRGRGPAPRAAPGWCGSTPLESGAGLLVTIASGLPANGRGRAIRQRCAARGWSVICAATRLRSLGSGEGQSTAVLPAYTKRRKDALECAEQAFTCLRDCCLGGVPPTVVRLDSPAVQPNPGYSRLLHRRSGVFWVSPPARGVNHTADLLPPPPPRMPPSAASLGPRSRSEPRATAGPSAKRSRPPVRPPHRKTDPDSHPTSARKKTGNARSTTSTCGWATRRGPAHIQDSPAQAAGPEPPLP
jgi:hypothetical protein